MARTLASPLANWRRHDAPAAERREQMGLVMATMTGCHMSYGDSIRLWKNAAPAIICSSRSDLLIQRSRTMEWTTSDTVRSFPLMVEPPPLSRTFRLRVGGPPPRPQWPPTATPASPLPPFAASATSTRHPVNFPFSAIQIIVRLLQSRAYILLNTSEGKSREGQHRKRR